MTKKTNKSKSKAHPWYDYPWYDENLDMPQLGKNRNILQKNSMTLSIMWTRAITAYARDMNGLVIDYKSFGIDDEITNYKIKKKDRISVNTIRRLAGLPKTYKLRAVDIYEGVKYPK
jgi:hypothetical protein